ncbi:MAG: RluA family pseudouridine synthase [Eubacteriaceae bacterium]
MYKVKENHEKTLRDELSMGYDYSSRLIREIKREGKITLNQKECFLGEIIKKEDCIRVKMPEERIDAEASCGPLEIVYEDQEILIVNKGVKCVTHPTKSHHLDTLSNYISYHWKLTGTNAKIRFINRLDRDTSGLVAVAKNKYIHAYVQKQMLEGNVEKIYHAFVNGRLPNKSGVIDEPIGQPYEDSIHRVVTDKGKKSVTYYRVIEEYNDATLVELSLKTGRTHQIRVHLNYIGNPIIGDPLYNEIDNKMYGIEHQALHARFLRFSLPDKKDLCFEAEYSNALIALRNQLRKFEKKR